MSPPRDLEHLNKRRAAIPARKRPTKYSRSSEAADISDSVITCADQDPPQDLYLYRQFVTLPELQPMGDEILV